MKDSGEPRAEYPAYVASYPAYGQPTVGLPIGQILSIFRRRQRVILSVVAAVTAVAVLFGLNRSETYTATVTVLIQPQENQIDGLEQVGQGLSSDDASIETEVKYIVSHENLARAVDQLDLADDPTLLFPEREPGMLASLPLGDLLIGGGRAAAVGEQADASLNRSEDRDAFERRAVAALRAGLEVTQSGYSNILAINFTASDAVTAARLADGIAGSYVQGQLDRKLDELTQIREVLRDRVEDLRLQLMESERAVEEYRTENNLVDGSSIDAQQIATLTTQLIDVRAERTTKQAKLRQVTELRERGAYDLLDDAFASPQVLTLREEELALARREAELSQEFGPRHPRIQQLSAEQEKLARRIAREIDDAVRALENEVAIDTAREEALRATLERTKGDVRGRSNLTSQASVQLRELEREASASRALYETFLVRLKQLEEQEQISRPDVRIVSPAEVPDAPSSPSLLTFAFVGFTGSLVLGSILGFLLEQQDTSLRSSKQLEGLLDIPPLGLIPAVSGNRTSLQEYLSGKPGSAYAEGVRSLYAQVRLAKRTGPAKVFLVTSALPGEGKTSLAGSLAFCAAQLQQRVLLIDLDLRRPAVAGFFGLEPETGIVELISGGAFFKDVVQKGPGLDVLPAVERHQNPIALLTSERLQSLVKQAREYWDLVVIDAPPVLGMADAKLLAPTADAVVFVIRWESTKLDAARSALKELNSLSANVIGGVLNRVDMKRHSYYAYGDAGQYHHKYKHYYKD